MKDEEKNPVTSVSRKKSLTEIRKEAGDRWEKRYLEAKLAEFGSVSATARELNTARSHLIRKIKYHGINSKIYFRPRIETKE